MIQQISDRKIEFSICDDMELLTCGLLIERPIDQVFEFFSDAFKLQDITPPEMQFRVTTPGPLEIQEGTEIDYKLKIMGLPMRWRSLISVWQPPYCFVDEQLKGPYSYWHHLHTFESVQGGTYCYDEVRYKVPFTRLLNGLFVQRELRQIFDYRQSRLLTLLSKQKKVATY